MLLPSKGKVPGALGVRGVHVHALPGSKTHMHANRHEHEFAHECPHCTYSHARPSYAPFPSQDTYQAVKQASDSAYSVPTQCFVAQKAGVGRSSPPPKGRLQYVANLALKINVKVRGGAWLTCVPGASPRRCCAHQAAKPREGPGGAPCNSPRSGARVLAAAAQPRQLSHERWALYCDLADCSYPSSSHTHASGGRHQRQAAGRPQVHAGPGRRPALYDHGWVGPAAH